jgi:hypothetical protein
MGVLGVGAFVVTLVAVNGGDRGTSSRGRRSGTGGFALIGETTLPIRHGLDDSSGRRALGLPERLPARFVPLRVREGDDPSCLNLNRTANPRLLGVDPSALADRDAFAFAGAVPGLVPGWALLDAEPSDGTVPAIADESVITWGLDRRLGDVVALVDDAGRPLRLRLVASLRGSILQGGVVLSERHFTGHYPTETGHRAFLVDVDAGQEESTSAALRRALRDHGLVLQSTTRRLAELHAVETTYVAIFLALGGLGLVLGTAGSAAIAARDVLARAGELSCLRAVGFRPGAIARMVAGEHGLVLVLGTAIGALAGLIGGSAGRLGGLDVGTALVLSLTLAAVPATGVLAALLACRLSTRQGVLAGLRSE